MRILFVSNDFAGASLARRLVLEGHEVRAFVADPTCERVMLGLIPRLPSLDAGLDWIGLDGLAVVDDTGFGEWQDAARADGYAVVGGSALGDRLENDRAWAMDTLSSFGIPILPTLRFSNCSQASDHIRENPSAWAVKFDHHAPKAATFIGTLPCGSDATDFLNLCTGRCNSSGNHCGTILQSYVEGIEIAVGRYFNGTDWTGPIGINIEHKRFFNDNLGPNTFEMGTLVWYEKKHTLFSKFLAPLEQILREGNHRGEVDVNCIVNENGVFPLEFTVRFCWPTTQAQIALHRSPWGAFLDAMARGRSFDLDYRPGYALAVFIALPPFPFACPSDARGSSFRGMPVRFRRSLTSQEISRVHYESIEFRTDGEALLPTLCDDSGYALHVTGHGTTIAAARQQTYDLARLVAVPGAYYRTDIGENCGENIRRLEELLQPLGEVQSYTSLRS
jgi:phosphoribosylamine--glycine ligase